MKRKLIIFVNFDSLDPDPFSPATSESEEEKPKVSTSSLMEDAFEEKVTSVAVAMETCQECEVCGVQIPIRNIYEHMYSHVEDFAYKCPNSRCNHTFLTRYSVAFLAHRLKGGSCWKAANITQKCNQNVCEQCSQSNFPGTRQFGLHLKTHENEMASEKKFHCPVKPCKEGFALRQSLEYHLHASHDPQLVKKSQEKSLQKVVQRRRPAENHKCSSCEKSFTTIHILRRHVKYIHEGMEGEYVCEECGKRFTTNQSLQFHKLIHTGQRPYQCHICGMAFRLDRFLRRHLRSKLVHQKEKGKKPSSAAAGEK